MVRHEVTFDEEGWDNIESSANFAILTVFISLLYYFYDYIMFCNVSKMDFKGLPFLFIYPMQMMVAIFYLFNLFDKL